MLLLTLELWQKCVKIKWRITLATNTGRKWRDTSDATTLAGVSPIASDPDVALSVAEAAARVGLTAATLRTWDRRYGLAPSIRTEGGHRRYNILDVARLRVVQQMVDGGVPPSEAVAASLELSPDALRRGEPGQAGSVGRAGGGNVLALPGGDEIQRGLARAAVSLDAPTVTERVSELLEEHGVVTTWENVLVPVLTALGERWYQTKRGIEIEHVTADAVARALQSHGPVIRTGQRPILLACMPDELHTLPLTALQAALRDAGHGSVMLGARVPLIALQDAVKRLRPRRVVLWAQLPQVADPGIMAQLPRQRPPVLPLVAGPGWAPHDNALPGVPHPGSLGEAVDVLTAPPGVV